MNNLKYVNGGGKNKGIVLLKFLAALLITYSHMAILFPKFQGLVTGGAIGDGLFFFCSGFTLFLGRNDNFINWYAENGASPPTLNGLIHPVLPLNWP